MLFTVVSPRVPRASHLIRCETYVVLGYMAMWLMLHCSRSFSWVRTLGILWLDCAYKLFLFRIRSGMKHRQLNTIYSVASPSFDPMNLYTDNSGTCYLCSKGMGNRPDVRPSQQLKHKLALGYTPSNQLLEQYTLSYPNIQSPSQLLSPVWSRIDCYRLSGLLMYHREECGWALNLCARQPLRVGGMPHLKTIVELKEQLLRQESIIAPWSSLVMSDKY